MTTHDERFTAIRKNFAGTARGPYLDVAVRGLMSRASRAALDRHLDDLQEGTVDKSALFKEVETTRGLLAKLIGAAPKDVAYTRNVTDGIATFAASIDWRSGDSIVLCEAIEHPANVLPWYGIARKFGVAVRNVPQTNGTIEIPRIVEAMGNSCRVVAISSVSFAPGFRFPVAELAAECRKRGVMVCVDAAQSIGIIKTDVAEWDVDAISVSTQKGLMTMYGAGFLYVRPELSENMNPIFLSRYSIANEGHEASLGDPARLALAEGARRFDVGNPNFPAVVAVTPALELLLELDPRAVEDYVLSLAAHFAERMLAIGLPVYGGRPGPHSSHIVTVGAALGQAHDAARDLEMSKLYEHLVAAGVRLSIRRDLLRFSFHIYNNRDDVDEVVRLCEGWLRARGKVKAA